MYSATPVTQSDLPKAKPEACGTLEMRLKMKELCQPSISHTLTFYIYCKHGRPTETSEHPNLSSEEHCIFRNEQVTG